MSKYATSIVTEEEGNGFYVAQFKTQNLAIFSYYVESNKSVYLIDPTYDIFPYQELLKKRQAKLQAVCLTHYHADFISGHTEFNVPILMGPSSLSNLNSFKVTEMKDGEKFQTGSINTVVLHTPGHTPESSSFLLVDSDGKEFCVFTGDTVFLGDVGRPDLAVSGTISKEDLASMLFDSIQKMKKFDDNLRIYPGHGSGSACGKSIGAGNFCTIGAQKQKNYGFTIQEREEFISKLTQDLPAPPTYFFHDAKTNKTGPSNHDEQLKKVNIPLSIEEFQKLAEKSTIFDTRGNVEGGLIKGAFWTHEKGSMCNWVSMLTANPEEPILLVVDEGRESEFLERLLRVGFFNIQGYNNFKVSDYPGEKFVPKIINGEEALQVENRTHLDVRNINQYVSTGVFENSLLIPLPELKKRVEEARDKPNILVNCRTGIRARFAYSILANAGIEATVLADNITNYEGQGHKFVKHEA